MNPTSSNPLLAWQIRNNVAAASGTTVRDQLESD